MRVAYRIGAAAPKSHLFDVVLRIEDITADSVTLRMPAWIPGSYMIRDYARHVVAVQARDADGVLINVDRPDKSSWRIAAAEESLSVLLQVYAFDVSVRGAHLDATHAYFNGVCVFPEVLGAEGELPVTIDRPIDLPDSAVVATSLRAVDIDAAGFGAYVAEDYDALIDQPVEIAEQTQVTFDVDGIAHRFYVRGEHDFDTQRLGDETARVCHEHHALLGRPTDLDRYVFMAYALDQGYGGLEHRWSTSLEISRKDLPRDNVTHDVDAWRKCLGLISHEYFHLWNVRRLKPAAFTPIDPTQENHTGLLWVFEGITSYYDDLAMVRSGVISIDEYLQLLGQMLTRVYRMPGRWRQSLEQSSFDAWTRFYKQDENSANAIISYYTKGAMAALALDLTLRRDTSTTLDAVMRACWQRFYLDDASGMPERGIEAVVCELAQQDMSEFFDAWIRGTDDIDLKPILASVGIELHLRAAAPGSDAGGKPAAKTPTTWTGLRFAANDPNRVAAVINGSPGEQAGICVGDRLIALAGKRVGAAGLASLMLGRQPGDALSCHLFRGESLLETTITLVAPPNDTAWLTLDQAADDATLARRERWLSSLRLD